MSSNLYRMAIYNVTKFIRDQSHDFIRSRDLNPGASPPITACDAATILSAVFCKNYSEVLEDMILVKLEQKEPQEPRIDGYGDWDEPGYGYGFGYEDEYDPESR